jgi:hypothetical protein
VAHDSERDKKRYAEDPEYRERRRATVRAYKQRNKDRLNASSREKYATDPDYRAKQNAKGRAYKRSHRDSINAQTRERYATDPVFRAKKLSSKGRGPIHRRAALKRYGLTEQEYDAILSQQGHACGICERPFSKTPCVDHCHITRMVRGLLCHGCNLGLGHLEDNPVFAYKAGAYLERWLMHLLEICNIEESDMTTSNTAAEESEIARMIREAIAHELQKPVGTNQPPAANWLEALARALIVKAGEGDVQALKEVFDRAGGRMSSAPAASAPRQLTLSWKNPPPVSKKAATKSRAGNSSPSTSGSSRAGSDQ